MFPPPGPSPQAALNHFSAQPAAVPGIALTQGQEPALGLVELDEAGHLSSMSGSLWMPSLPSSASTALHRSVASANLLRVLDPTVCVADKDVEQGLPQHRPLRDSIRHRSPAGHSAIDRDSLCAAIQPIPCPPAVHPANSCLSRLETRTSCGRDLNEIYLLQRARTWREGPRAAGHLRVEGRPRRW